MPTSLDLKNVFGSRGPEGYTKDVAAQLRKSEEKGRLERGVQVQDCRFSHRETCEFNADDGGTKLTDWISFGQIQFTEEPSFSTGSIASGQDDEEPLAEEYQNFDPTVHLRVPGAAMVACYQRNNQGFFTGAKILCYALASVPDGYRVAVWGTWTGPAVRIGGQ